MRCPLRNQEIGAVHTRTYQPVKKIVFTVGGFPALTEPSV
jgi:hypothetical protein